MNIKGVHLFCLTAFLLIACSQEKNVAAPVQQASAEMQVLKDEVEKLRIANNVLARENAELKNTPTNRLATISSLVAARDEAKAKAALELFKSKFPEAPEVVKASMLVTSFLGKIAQEQQEVERQKQLGLKVFTENPQFKWHGLKIQLTSGSISNRWVYDDHGNEYTYQVASRGSNYVVANLSITSELHDPELPGIAIYEAREGSLKKLDELRYQFVRWRDYGTYLGNSADMGNDFSKTSTIPFTAGATFDTALVKKALFVVMSKQGCHQRSYERLSHPPVRYTGTCDLLKDTLTINDLKGESAYQIIKIFNRGSL